MTTRALQQFCLCQSASKVLRLLLLSFLLAMTVQAQRQGTESKQEYTLQISAREPIVAHVSANIFIKDGHLFTGEGGADQFPRHWAVFVKNLQVRDGREHPLPVSEVTNKDSEKGEWIVGDAYSGPAKITYDVDLGFTKAKWDPSNEKAGYFDGKALYVVTKVLFLASVTDKPANLRIVVPSGNKIATPWNALDTGDEQTLVVPTTFDLQQNSIVVGDFDAHEVRQGNFRFTVALLGQMKESGEIAASTMAIFARHYAQMFPSTPPSGYLLTIFYADYENGESFERSAAFVTARRLTQENLIIWGNTQGHELFHFWCGQQITGAQSDQSRWFEEGFTEYNANLTLIREHLVSEDLFIKKMENMLGKYLYFRSAPQFAQVSILDSGTRKTTYRFGVYNGGWAVAFGLDMTIRQSTANKRTLDDFMRAMYDRFGVTHKKFSYEELVATASQVAGVDLSSFFQRYVQGKETMPVAEWLRNLGYEALVQDYADEMYIQSIHATPLRETWLK